MRAFGGWRWMVAAVVVAVQLAVPTPSMAQVQVQGQVNLPAALRVGTGKVDITPAAGKMPAPFTTVHDPIYTRAIRVEGGGQAALLINVDLAAVSDEFFAQVIQRLSMRSGVPPEAILISATHDHSTPSAGREGPRDAGGGPTGLAAAYTEQVEKAILQAAAQAQASLQPAEMGFGEGMVYLNANRDAIDRDTRLWVQKPNLDFPSDKTLAVLAFRKPGTRQPIAVYFNYASHDLLFLTQAISGGFMGAAERYIEEAHGHPVVAVWTSGAAGDQNPLYMRVQNAIAAQRLQQEMAPGLSGDAEDAERGAAIFRLMFGMNQRPAQPLDAQVQAQGWAVNDAMGRIMAEEALRVMAEIDAWSGQARVQASTATLTCPGRDRLDNGREGRPGQYQDGADVQIRLGALTLGDVALPYIGAEVYNLIGQQVKQQSPYRHTVFVTWTSGRANSGYIPSDDAFGRYTFQVLGSRLKPGCAQTGIVRTTRDLLRAHFGKPGR